MVTLNQNYRTCSTAHRPTRLTRQTTSRREPFTPNAKLLSLRARYYDCHTGEFTSQDPLDYVDGMSLYQGWFTLNGTDSRGTCTLCDGSELVSNGWNNPKNEVLCFSKDTGECFWEEGGSGKFVRPDVCPRTVCPILNTDGSIDEWRHLTPGEETFLKFLIQICKETTNKIDPCGYCARFFPGSKSLQQACKKACEEATGNFQESICEQTACLSVTKGLPGAECYKTIFRPDGTRDYSEKASTNCNNCCDKLSTENAKNNCRIACNYWTDPSNW